MKSDSENKNLMSPAAFARRMGWKSKSYVFQLKKEGRLVMTADQKKVCVAESIKKIEETRDPSKSEVAARHAQQRAQVDKDDFSNIKNPNQESENEESAPSAFGQPYDFQNAKAKREHWAAEREHAAWRKEAGELMEKSDVVAAFADAGATIRMRLESWVSTLPPQLIERDESAIRSILADHTDRLLNDLADKFNRSAGHEQHV